MHEVAQYLLKSNVLARTLSSMTETEAASVGNLGNPAEADSNPCRTANSSPRKFFDRMPIATTGALESGGEVLDALFDGELKELDFVFEIELGLNREL
jgi:hypothetical protein